MVTNFSKTMTNYLDTPITLMNFITSHINTHLPSVSIFTRSQLFDIREACKMYFGPVYKSNDFGFVALILFEQMSDESYKLRNNKRFH